MFGDRLQELRKDHKLTQKQLAEILSISRHTVSSYECNRSTPNDQIKYAIAKYFNVSIDYLIGAVDTEERCKSNTISICIPKSLSKESHILLRQFIKFLELKDNGNFDIHN